MTLPNLDMVDLMLQSMSVKVNVDPSQGITTAEHHKYYPELGIPWREGLNIVNGDTTVQRSYSELEFPSSTPIWVEEIDLGEIDEIDNERYFYKLTTNFYESTYSSSSGFYKWEYKKQMYLLEKWFYNTKDIEVIWTSPKPITQFPHIIKFNPGKALGLEVSSSEYVYVGDIITKNIKLSPIASPEIHIRLIDKVPNVLLIKLYGLREVTSRRRFHPINEVIEERATLIHPINKEYSDRLIPPNKNFNKQFWNDPLRVSTEETLIERPLLHKDLHYGFID